VLTFITGTTVGNFNKTRKHSSLKLTILITLVGGSREHPILKYTSYLPERQLIYYTIETNAIVNYTGNL